MFKTHGLSLTQCAAFPPFASGLKIPILPDEPLAHVANHRGGLNVSRMGHEALQFARVKHLGFWVCFHLKDDDSPSAQW